MYWRKKYDSTVHIDLIVHVDMYSWKPCTEGKRAQKKKRVDDPTLHIDMY